MSVLCACVHIPSNSSGCVSIGPCLNEKAASNTCVHVRQQSHSICRQPWDTKAFNRSAQRDGFISGVVYTLLFNS